MPSETACSSNDVESDDENDVEDRVIAAVSEISGVKPSLIQPESKLEKDLGCDSTDIWEIIFELESIFNVELPDDDLATSKPEVSVADLIQAVNTALQGKRQEQQEQGEEEKEDDLFGL